MAIVHLVPNNTESAEAVLDRARAAGLKQVVIIGWDEADECFFDSNIPDGPPVMWLLKIAERALMDTAHEEVT